MTQSHGSSLPPRRLLLRHEGPKTAGLPTWSRTNQKEMDNVLLAEDPGFRSAADNAGSVLLRNGPAALEIDPCQRDNPAGRVNVAIAVARLLFRKIGRDRGHYTYAFFYL